MMPETPTNPERESRQDWLVKVFASVVSVNSLALGTQIGLLSMMAPLLKKYFGLSGTEISVYQSAMLFAAIFGALGVSSLLDPLGRLNTLAFASGMFLIGTFIVAASWSYGMLLAGTAVIGIGAGAGLAIDPLYISEIAKSNDRGHFVTFSEIFIVFGQLFGFASGFLVTAFVPNTDRWRIIASTGALPPLFLLLAVAFVLPESPRWLAANGRTEDAMKVFQEDLAYSRAESEALVQRILKDLTDLQRQARGSSLLTEEFSLLFPFRALALLCCSEPPAGTTTTTTEALDEDAESSSADAPLLMSRSVLDARHPWVGLMISLRTTPATRGSLSVAVGIAACQMLSGVDVVVFNLSFLMTAIGVTSPTVQTALFVLVGLCRFVTALVVANYLDKVGRRPLVLGSAFGNCLLLAAMASAMAIFMSDDSKGSTPAVTMILLVCLASVAFEAGLGPGTWLVSSEVLFNKIRLPALGLATATNRFVDAVLVASSFLVRELLGWTGLFAVLALLSVFVVAFVFVHLPETANKSLEDMFDYFDQREAQKSAVAALAEQFDHEELDYNNDIFGAAERHRRRPPSSYGGTASGTPPPAAAAASSSKDRGQPLLVISSSTTSSSSSDKQR